jgi:hypothetical protein
MPGPVFRWPAYLERVNSMIAEYIIDYTPELKVANVQALPRGLGSPYLLVIMSPFPNEWIAKRWLRKLPTKRPGQCERILRF